MSVTSEWYDAFVGSDTSVYRRDYDPVREKKNSSQPPPPDPCFHPTTLSDDDDDDDDDDVWNVISNHSLYCLPACVLFLYFGTVRDDGWHSNCSI
jgi:hypothetical protein